MFHRGGTEDADVDQNPEHHSFLGEKDEILNVFCFTTDITDGKVCVCLVCLCPSPSGRRVMCFSGPRCEGGVCW